MAVVTMRQVHKGAPGANGAQDNGAPVYTHAVQDGGGADQELMLVLDRALYNSLGRPAALTVDITSA